jgi:hypothetical protein
MSIFSQPKISYNKETQEIGFSWEPTKEEMLHLHNYTWEAANEGKNRERERILELLENYKDAWDCNAVEIQVVLDLIQLIGGKTK